MDDVNKTLDSRGSQYGEFHSHAKISQELKHSLMLNCSPDDRFTHSMAEAIDMIFHKIARIMNGNPEYIDNWHDIQGYARLVEIELQEQVDNKNNKL